MGGTCDNKKGDLNSAHMFCRVLGYKRGSDITKDDIAKIRVYRCP